MPTRQRIAFGDWQTPRALADDVLAKIARAPRSILEPTCGRGAFLAAAAARFPRAKLCGFDIDAGYIAEARAALPAADLRVADFFAVDWDAELGALAEPILVVGNPPWVTSAALGALGVANLPRKHNARGLAGLDALTGKSNFDVSEWMMIRLLEALAGRDATFAVLVKSSVMRKILERDLAIAPLGIWQIDAPAHFGASVDAVLFAGTTGKRAPWPVYAALDDAAPRSHVGLIDGALTTDVDAFVATRHLAGVCEPVWRSGVKHDCAAIMELAPRGDAWVNGLGEAVEIEPDVTFPLLKSSDVANGRPPRRRVIATQRRLGEDTARLPPRASAYLRRHRAQLDARKSSIYRGQPPFAMFGVGPYTFAPWKVAISGLYKRLAFRLVGPVDGRPVLLDDTCYFLPFDREADARRAYHALRSEPARAYFEARIFWNEKRPIGKALLQSLPFESLTART